MIDDISGIAKCQEKSVILNSIINAKIESKKLEFNLKKCTNMHIGPNKQHCTPLKIHGKEMMNTNTQTYLGDTISNTGSNTENIKQRCKIGHSAISQIKSLLKDMSMGKFGIQIGLILRDSIFVSKMLLNSEVWYCVTQSQIRELEKIDRILFRYILGAHSKTAIEWLYADTGRLNMESLMQIRRLMYLWHVLCRDKDELIRRVYDTQKVASNTGDWYDMVQKDKQQLGIHMTDTDIQGVSKEWFKNFVKEKIKTNFLKHLKSLKTKHSKSVNLQCDDLKTADYIDSPRLSLKEKQLPFKLRSRTLDVKDNFRNQHKDHLCISCGLFPETQSHLLECPEIVKKLGYVANKNENLDENFVCGCQEEQKIIQKYIATFYTSKMKSKQIRWNNETNFCRAHLHMSVT